MVNSPNIFKAFRNTLKLLSFFSIFYILMSKFFTIIITKKTKSLLSDITFVYGTYEKKNKNQNNITFPLHYLTKDKN